MEEELTPDGLYDGNVTYFRAWCITEKLGRVVC